MQDKHTQVERPVASPLDIAIAINKAYAGGVAPRAGVQKGSGRKYTLAAPFRFVGRVDRREPGSDPLGEAADAIEVATDKLLARFDRSETDSAEVSPEAAARYAKRIATSLEYWRDSYTATKRITGLEVGYCLYAAPTAPVLILAAAMLQSGEIEIECVCDYLRITRIKAARGAHPGPDGDAETRATEAGKVAPTKVNNATFDIGDGLGLEVPERFDEFTG